MYELKFTTTYKKSYKLMKKRGLDLSLLDDVVDQLRQGKQLEEKYHDHPLSGKYQGFRECHIKPDWLLLYLIENNILTLTLVDTGRRLLHFSPLIRLSANSVYLSHADEIGAILVPDLKLSQKELKYFVSVATAAIFGIFYTWTKGGKKESVSELISVLKSSVEMTAQSLSYENRR